MKSDLKNMSLNQLKEEYISCAFGAMIYGANTDMIEEDVIRERLGLEPKEQKGIDSCDEEIKECGN